MISAPAVSEDPGQQVAVVGAGLAGLAAAIGFAASGFDTILCGAPERTANGRTVALLDGSVSFLKTLCVWPDVERRAAPLRALRIVDDTGSLWRAPTVEFRSSEIGLDAFGWNIENAELVGALAAHASHCTGLETIPERITAFDWGAEHAVARCESGRSVAAKLIVAADGRFSRARVAADISTRLHPLPQTALTAILSHSRPHEDFSTEFHTSQGPFTLVPLPAGPNGAPRSSLVWVMSDEDAKRRAALDDADLAAEIEDQAQSIHGAMRIAGGRGAFPLATQSARRATATRLALIGDAAHVLPPIGAQGLNLGLRDAACLIETAEAARSAGGDIGGPDMLARYADARRLDVALRTGAVNTLNRSLIARLPPVDFARATALAALAAIGPLRRFAMREGIAPRFGATSGKRSFKIPAEE